MDKAVASFWLEKKIVERGKKLAFIKSLSLSELVNELLKEAIEQEKETLELIEKALKK